MGYSSMDMNKQAEWNTNMWNKSAYTNMPGYQAGCTNMPGYGNAGCANPCGNQNVIQTYEYDDAYQYVNYHTHYINNCIKRNYLVPVYTTSCETRVIEQCPVMVNQCPGTYAPMTNLNDFFVPFPTIR